MSTHDVDGLNAGYARALLDDYLENPEAVPSEWRALFESGDSVLVATVMSRDQQRLVKIGFAVTGICFVAGAALQVITHHPLY